LNWPDLDNQKSSMFLNQRRRRTRVAVKAVLRMTKVNGHEDTDVKVKISECWKPGNLQRPKTYTQTIRNEMLARSALLAYKIVGKALAPETRPLFNAKRTRTMELLPGGPQDGATYPSLPNQTKTNPPDIIVDTQKYTVQNADLLKRVSGMCCKDDPPKFEPPLDDQTKDLGEALQQSSKLSVIEKLKALHTAISKQREHTDKVSQCVNTWKDNGGGQWGRKDMYLNPASAHSLWAAQSMALQKRASLALQVSTEDTTAQEVLVRNQAAAALKTTGVVSQMCAEMMEQRAEESKMASESETWSENRKLEMLSLLQKEAGPRLTLPAQTKRHLAKRRSKHRLAVPNSVQPGNAKQDLVKYNRPWTLPANFHRRGKPNPKLGESRDGPFQSAVNGAGGAIYNGAKGVVNDVAVGFGFKKMVRSKLKFPRLKGKQYENPCYSYGPQYCCQNFAKYQCGIKDYPGRPPFGRPDNTGYASWSGLSGDVNLFEVGLPFRITPKNTIEFALESDACNVDERVYKGKTKECTTEEMGAGFSLGTKAFGMISRGGTRGMTKDSSKRKDHPKYFPHTLDGTDVLCNMARSAIMRCSSGGTRGGYIPGRKHAFYDNSHTGKIEGQEYPVHPLDYTSAESLRMLRVEAAQAFITNILPVIGKHKDSIGIEPMVEPLYNPVWRPYYKQRTANENYTPRHLCQCVKPYFIQNDAKGCKPIRVYDGYTLAGQKCNARVVDYAEIPATYKKEYLCCDTWKTFWEGLMRIKYCDPGDGSEPKVTVQMRVRLVPMKGMIPVTFYPPARALMGSCNSYVKMLSLGLKYGGTPFRLELKRASKAQLEDWTAKGADAAIEARIEIFQENEKEVKHKMTNRQTQWLLAKAAREQQWRENWGINEAEYNTWTNDCCWSSLVCMIMGMILQVEFFGGKGTQCLLLDQVPSRERARQAFVRRYGLSREIKQGNWVSVLRAGIRL